ncbi:hypothetical protein LFX25_04105 [Leptospira sp. FAT2]|uniref:hypothetical protein n=1 Tax=Leptospira sanjuanensis TaxID=2879643 RepID=UPI001EE93DB7|nr:hypothetical protein [Leptospira sanjuanensis]MCG6192420.1 hypothetical protein [Leptospira sanjuanensis]
MIRKWMFFFLFGSIVNCAGWERLVSPSRWERIGTPQYKNAQVFVIDPQEDVEIEAEEGTKIRFPKGSLLAQNGGLVSSPVRIEISEYYKNEDILLSGLTTVSSGRPIQTKGMISLNGYMESGGKVKVNPKNPPQVSFASSFEPGYEMFYGTKNGDGVLDWSTQTAKTTNTSGLEMDNDFAAAAKNNTQENLNILNIENRKNESKGNRMVLAKYQSASYADSTERITESGPAERRVPARNSYYYPILNFGWINCDRFLYMGLKLIPLNIDTNYPTYEDETTYLLIIPSVRSVLPAYKDANNRVYFPNLPPGEKTILYALKKSGVTRWQVWIRETVVGKEDKLVPEWELVGPKTLEKRIRSLNF